MRNLLLFLLTLFLATTGISQSLTRHTNVLIDEGTPATLTVAGNQSDIGIIRNDPQPDVMSTWVLPSTNSTSGNSRIPRNAGVYFQRTEYLITAAEMAASGFPSGNTIDAIGFLIATAGVGTQTGTLNIYLKNTTDASYTLGSTWTTAGFTQVCNNTAFSVPIAAGSYSIPFVNGTPFTYTGAGVYVAWEFSNPSLSGGTTALVAYCNTTQATMLYGAQSTTALPTTLAVSAFRPATYFTNNALTDIAQVNNIYATEKLPTPFGVPSNIGVRVSNVSASAVTFDVILTVTDVATSTVRYTSTSTVTALAAGTSTTVNFPAYSPTILENVTITATTSTIAGETFTANNTKAISATVNNNQFSYNYTVSGPGGYGFTYPGTGIFASKYTMNGTGVVKGMTLFLYNFAANTGNTIFGCIMNSSGTILSQTPDYTILASDLGTTLNFTFPAPQTITNDFFYVGIGQSAGTVQWYPLGTVSEVPGRGNTFYNFAITGGTAAVSTADLKYAIDAVLVQPPTIQTTAATALTTTTATLNGTVNANSSNTTVSFQYGLTTAYGTNVSALPGTVTGNTTTPVSAAITGLTTNTLYHYRVVATNAGGTIYGNDMTFNTVALPTVVTTAASGVLATTATVNGTVNANNFSTTTSFEYGLTAAYGTSVPGVPSTVTGTSVNNVSANLTGLLPGNTYHYRINGTNAGGTVNGGDMTFVTPATFPAITTTNPTSVGATSATLNGTANASGATTTLIFEYGLTTAYGSTIAAVPGTVNGNSTTNVSANLTGLLMTTTYHYRLKGTNSIGTSNGNDMTFSTGCLVPSAAGPITGPSQVCQNGSGYVYTVAPITNATGYVWTLPTGGTITSGANTNSITVSYSTSAVSGYVTVAGSSSCSNGTSSQLPVNVNAPTLPAITGPTNICTSCNHVYTTQSGMTAYTWTVSAGGTITAGLGTNTITVCWNAAGSQTVSVNFTNPAGCSAFTPTVKNVTVLAGPTPTISGPSSSCTNIPGIVYTTQTGMNSYNWSISAGGTITSGLNTNSITVTWNTAGPQTVSVNYTNANGCSAQTAGVYNVTVNPWAIPVITGTNSLCVNSGYYNYTTQAGFSNYVWTTSAGGQITFGQGTNTVQVTWNSAGPQWVAVNYSSSLGCTNPSPVQFVVNVNAVPGTAGTITGTHGICGGSMGIPYSVAPVLYASTYVWNLPAGATIASGDGTNSITVDFAPNASAGNITVQPNNLCGFGTMSPPFAITVGALPAEAGTITGPSGVCIGATGVAYSVPQIVNSTGYVWTVPQGAAIASGANTNSITVNFGAFTGNGVISVYGVNSCGDGVASPDFQVTASPVPNTPFVTASGDLLSSTVSTGNQWYFSTTESGAGAPIAGATNQTYTATETGYYWSVVTVNGCSSDPSNKVYVVMVGQNELTLAALNIYPVPNNGKFTIAMIFNKTENVSIHVFNSIGMKVWSMDQKVVTGNWEQTVDLGSVAPGVYTVMVQGTQSQYMKKIVVN